MHIKEIEFGSMCYEAAKSFRNDWLRRPIGLELSAEDIAGEEHQIHIVVWDDDLVKGTVILKPISPTRLKLRQMAVSPEFRGQGIGRLLVQFAEKIGVEKGFLSLEAIARVTALPFYQKLGFQTEGDEFEEVTLPSIKVIKALIT